ncbi:PQQ-binding-like beta-propeller repeat protein [Shewanella psychrotolerans]|nr:PQQ-binding-like beta-propeller repeat protein [Shewanella psychrotolerans]
MQSLNRRGYWLLLLLPLLLLSACSDVTPAKAPEQTHRLVEDTLIDGALSKNARLAVTLTRTRTVTVWDTTTNKPIYRWPPEQFDTPAYLIALSGNNRYVAVAGKRQISLFDLTNGQLALHWQVNGFDPDASISSMSFNQSGKQVAIGMNEGSIIIVNLSSQQLSMFKQHDTEVSHLEFSQVNEHILSAGYDGKVLWWATSSGEVIKEFSLPQRITSTGFDQANRRLFFADSLDNHRIIDPSSNTDIAQLNFLERYRYFRKALFIEHGQELLTATSKQAIIHWDAKTGQEIQHWEISAFSLGTTVMDMVLDDSGKLLTLSSDAGLERWAL